MRKRSWALLVTALALILTAVILQWPRIEDGVVQVTRTQRDENTVELEYRMREPFRVAVSHWLKEKDLPPPSETGIRVGGRDELLRKERRRFLRPSRAGAEP
jgi:hypothetical protein